MDALGKKGIWQHLECNLHHYVGNYFNQEFNRQKKITREVKQEIWLRSNILQEKLQGGMLKSNHERDLMVSNEDEAGKTVLQPFTNGIIDDKNIFGKNRFRS